MLFAADPGARVFALDTHVLFDETYAYWQQVEEYVSAHTRAEFSHGLCPECMARLYPGIDVAGGVEMGASPGEE